MSHTDIPGRRRYWIYLLLFFLAVINTSDRAALSVAAHPIADEFGISAVGMGYLFSSVLWSYLFCLIPAGILADRLGTRAAVLHGPGMRAQLPQPRWRSGDADGDRASQVQHAVERVDSDVHLGRPTLVRVCATRRRSPA